MRLPGRCRLTTIRLAGRFRPASYVALHGDRVVWEWSGHGVGPVVVIPMNAPRKPNRRATFER